MILVLIHAEDGKLQSVADRTYLVRYSMDLTWAAAAVMQVTVTCIR